MKKAYGMIIDNIAIQVFISDKKHIFIIWEHNMNVFYRSQQFRNLKCWIVWTGQKHNDGKGCCYSISIVKTGKYDGEILMNLWTPELNFIYSAFWKYKINQAFYKWSIFIRFSNSAEIRLEKINKKFLFILIFGGEMLENVAHYKALKFSFLEVLVASQAHKILQYKSLIY